MKGLVLAAGLGKRLLPDTLALPKTLLPVRGKETLLDITLQNMADIGLSEVVLVLGHFAEVVVESLPRLAQTTGLRFHTVLNDRYDWNNAYSLWSAREHMAEGVLLVNGDTLHPLSVEKSLFDQRGAGLLLAVDSVKTLTEEAMKVTIESGHIAKITKEMPVDAAHGEYIGAALIEPWLVPDLVRALEDTWRDNPHLYYEDGFQTLIDRGAKVAPAHIGRVDWVEVDDHADLIKAREIACRY